MRPQQTRQSTQKRRTTMTSNVKNGRQINNVVLVHGGFVDGSGWESVYTMLKKQGYNVAIVQNPTISLADDVAVTKRIIAAQNGPVILVGHSYGGGGITPAGNHPHTAGPGFISRIPPAPHATARQRGATTPPR